MTLDEQIAFKSKEHAEAIRYMDNAEETLKKAGKDGTRYYADAKYVQTACGIAHLAVLRALDAWFELKGLPKPSKKQRKSIDYYTYNVAKFDGKVLKTLQEAYNSLHLSGYYDGTTRISTIKDGFDDAYEIIDRIKPENPVDVPETRGDRVNRALNRMMISLAVMFMRRPY
jgi:hypothetical protein